MSQRRWDLKHFPLSLIARRWFGNMFLYTPFQLMYFYPLTARVVSERLLQNSERGGGDGLGRYAILKNMYGSICSDRLSLTLLSFLFAARALTWRRNKSEQILLADRRIRLHSLIVSICSCWLCAVGHTVCWLCAVELAVTVMALIPFSATYFVIAPTPCFRE